MPGSSWLARWVVAAGVVGAGILLVPASPEVACAEDDGSCGIPVMCDRHVPFSYWVWIRPAEHGFGDVHSDRRLEAEKNQALQDYPAYGSGWYSPGRFVPSAADGDGRIWHARGKYLADCGCLFGYPRLSPRLPPGNYEGWLDYTGPTDPGPLDDPEQPGDCDGVACPPGEPGGNPGSGARAFSNERVIGNTPVGGLKWVCWVTDWYQSVNGGPWEFSYTEVHGCWQEEVTP